MIASAPDFLPLRRFTDQVAEDRAIYGDEKDDFDPDLDQAAKGLQPSVAGDL